MKKTSYKKEKTFDANLCEKAYQMAEKDLIPYHKAQSYITMGIKPPAGKTKGRK